MDSNRQQLNKVLNYDKVIIKLLVFDEHIQKKDHNGQIQMVDVIKIVVIIFITNDIFLVILYMEKLNKLLKNKKDISNDQWMIDVYELYKDCDLYEIMLAEQICKFTYLVNVYTLILELFLLLLSSILEAMLSIFS